MPKRGSVQLLLLSFRSRARLGWGVLAAGTILALGWFFHSGDDFPVLTKTGLAQVIRQSAWEHALAGPPEESWPWENASQGTNPKVSQLGLSAAVLTGTSVGQDEHLSLERPKPAKGNGAHAPRPKVSDVEVGDRITVTTADGSSRSYKVTGRRVVDPHLAETEPKPEDAEMALVTCSPLDPLLASSLRLVIQAIKIDPPVPPEASAEQKL
jgi:sortase family protein